MTTRSYVMYYSKRMDQWQLNCNLVSCRTYGKLHKKQEREEQEYQASILPAEILATCSYCTLWKLQLQLIIVIETCAKTSGFLQIKLVPHRIVSNFHFVNKNLFVKLYCVFFCLLHQYSHKQLAAHWLQNQFTATPQQLVWEQN